MPFEELTAEFIGEQHRWDQTIIGLAKPPRNGNAFIPKPIVIKTTAEEGEVVAGLPRHGHSRRLGDGLVRVARRAVTRCRV